MKFLNLISKFNLTLARTFSALNLFDSLVLRHATKRRQDHQVNLKNIDQTQANDDAAQAQLETLNTGVMKCWIVGPNYNWCNSGRGRN